MRFTFHYVSIKSVGMPDTPNIQISFTFHYVSIKSIESLTNELVEK